LRITRALRYQDQPLTTASGLTKEFFTLNCSMEERYPIVGPARAAPKKLAPPFNFQVFVFCCFFAILFCVSRWPDEHMKDCTLYHCFNV
jgi:hypothetical protein